MTAPAAVRASDAERQAVADRLLAAHGEGRLSLAEYDERVQRAYAAKTRADLEPLLADLPYGFPDAQLPAERAPRRRWNRKSLFWVQVAVLLSLAWFVAGLAVGHLRFPWPVFFIAFFVVRGRWHRRYHRRW